MSVRDRCLICEASMHPDLINQFTGMCENCTPDPFKKPAKPMADSGERKVFATGSQRDTQDGKPRPGLVSVYANLREGVVHMLGGIKYEVRNWEKGQPQSQFWESMMRHITWAMMGRTDEDHWAQARWNLSAILHQEEQLLAGNLPPELFDLPFYGKDPAAYIRRLPSRVFLDGDVKAAAAAARRFREQVEEGKKKESK